MSDETPATPETPAFRYDAKMAGNIEEKWQKFWDESGSFFADNPSGDLAGPLAEKDPFYVLDMFPYPSGKGLHVGHPLGYIATDVIARYQRMLGKNVLYTMGFDAFGLPAEQYAITTGQHPAISTRHNIDNMRTQLARIGLSHDKRRSIETTSDDYVRWTQWIFLQIFNSWFDPEAPRRDGKGKGAARPISELIAKFESGEKQLEDGRDWNALSDKEKNDVLYDYRLAYNSFAPVNWCPGLGTVLADEEVTADGRSERGDFPVFKTHLRQWMMRITAYADRLAEDLEGVNWPDKVRTMQRNWIGKSVGATVKFAVPAGDGRPEQDLEVFTTRPDTLFGATFMVVSPEHPLVGEVGATADQLTVPATWPEGTRSAWTGGYADPRQAVAEYRKQAAAKTEAERTGDDATEKTGVFTGVFGINPVDGRQVPIFVADYVLMGYGTGAIMAVPAHDDRDWAFAKKFDLDIITTIKPEEGFDPESGAWTGDGVLVNSANEEIDLNGMNKAESKAAMTAYLEKIGKGWETTTYRLRDWLFSRQRYWGEPFPVVYDSEGGVHAFPESMLPVTLPEIDDFRPKTFDPDDSESTPSSPLSRAEDWLTFEMDLGDGRGVQTYTRDFNTMPNWAGSCWYELRYLDPNNEDAFVSEDNESYWMGPRVNGGSGGTDLYVGGVEHAVLHLLYARFWHKVLFDLGHTASSEPFHRLFNQGMIEAYAYRDSRGAYVPAEEVEGDEKSGFTWQGQSVRQEYGKMGKSLKNIVTPDQMCADYGADTFRVYEMSMGPLDMSRPWETRAVVGAQRFLQRLWRNVIDENTGDVTVVDAEADLATKQLVARTIDQVREEFDNLRINTAIARMIVLNNHLTQLQEVPREAVEPLVLMVAPVAPHLAEELWGRLGHTESLVRADFPIVTDQSLLVDDTITCVVQVQGKVRARLEVPVNISEADLEKEALACEAIVKLLDGRDPLKVIVRAPKLVNVVLPR